MVRSLTGVVAFIALLAVSSANSQDHSIEKWTGRLRDGTILTRDSLDHIIKEHERWISSNGKRGQRANLVNAHLVGIDLSEVNLTGAHLGDADMSDAVISEVHLQEADLSGTNLTGAYLAITSLEGANLSGAKLRFAHLDRVPCSGANLDSADFRGADLTEMNLYGVALSTAYIDSTTTGVGMKWAELGELSTDLE